MRSCALCILEAATISMALVILRVFCTLLILVRISLLPAMSASVRCVFLEILYGPVQLRLVFLAEVLGLLEAIYQVAVLALEERAQGPFRGERLLHFDVVEVAVVDREERDGHFPDLQRVVLRLLHELGHHAAALELLARALVGIRGERRECRQLTVLGEREAHAAAGLLDPFGR